MAGVTAAIVSDLHLGLADGRDLLRTAPAQEALVAALAGVDELVLLGDVVELRERPVATAMAAARPALERIGRAVAGKPVTIVPGNHDHHLAAPLLESLGVRDGGGRLDLETFAAPPFAGPLAEVAATLGEADVRVAYPGVWVRPDVFATHGHYLDVHNTVPSFERLAIGAVQRVSGGLPSHGALSPDDYEAVLGPVYALTYALAQSARVGRPAPGGQASVRIWRMANGNGGRLPALLLGGVALPAAIAGLNLAGVGPLKADLSAVELRRAALRGMAEVVRRLGIEADHVIFGHTHRSGPRAGDEEGWTLPGGGRLMNTGSWIHEPAFLGSSPRESPYWPGHVAIVPGHGPPELLTLLDELP
jgi:predicted phosphodiesterase